MSWYTRYEAATESGVVLRPGSVDCVTVIASSKMEAGVSKESQCRIYRDLSPAPFPPGTVFGPFYDFADVFEIEALRTGLPSQASTSSIRRSGPHDRTHRS